MNFFAPLATTGETSRRDVERMPASVVRILEGALSAIGSRGARRLSMSDVSDASGVSRGTLYRYFSTKEEVLAAVSEFVSLNFEIGVREAADRYEEPLERFQAVMRFFAQFTVERTPERIFEIEPAFHLDFFRSHFDRHTAAVRAALGRSFDYLDTLRDQPLDRDALVEALVRMQLSTLIVPASRNWTEIWDCAPEKLECWIMELADRMSASKENEAWRP
jgi:AcrR family transcriptional regulator